MYAWADQKVGQAKYQLDRMEYKDVGQTMTTFSNKGADMAGNLKDMVSSLTGGFDAVGEINSKLPNLDDLVNAVSDNGQIANVGKVGEIEKDVNLADEDLKVFRDLAEMKYMQNIELKTLAPNINVTVPAAEGQTLDAEDVAAAVKVVLTEQWQAHTATAH